MSADNNIIDDDVDIDNSDNDNEQDLEKKEIETSKWILGKKPINFKKKLVSSLTIRKAASKMRASPMDMRAIQNTIIQKR